MSTFFMGYGMPKRRLWEVHAVLRSYFQSVHPAAYAEMKVAIDAYHKALEGETPDFLTTTFKVRDLFCKKNGYAAAMQVFEINHRYVFRVLTEFWMDELEDDLAKYLNLQLIFYQDSAEHDPEEWKNKATLNIIDQHISAKRYFILMLVDDSDLVHIPWAMTEVFTEACRRKSLLPPKKSRWVAVTPTDTTKPE